MTGAPHIKICGLKTLDAAQTAAQFGADAIGFVFVAQSPRCISIAAAAAIAHMVRPRVQIVGVFQGATVPEIAEHARRVPLDRVQIHGKVDEAMIAALAPTPLVVAISFEPDTIEADLRLWNDVRSRHAHLVALLIDTPDPSRLGGGTGKTFDWPMLRAAMDRVPVTLPIYLAGGLNAVNVADAVRTVRPQGVDVSSGVESARGVKSNAKITAFCEAVRHMTSV
ncbi:MAG: N-(5'-phosphoribosyl)anthranilate isomerase [Planctomycetes bacterium]|nr:N-(5'-phosphoribosyl)anthranilate isomerase [Planctomycetota bacterium]